MLKKSRFTYDLIVKTAGKLYSCNSQVFIHETKKFKGITESFLLLQLK